MSEPRNKRRAEGKAGSAINDSMALAPMSVAAIHVNRFYVMGTDGRARLAFGERDFQGGDHYRNAVSMNPADALEMARMIITMFGPKPVGDDATPPRAN